MAVKTAQEIIIAIAEGPNSIDEFMRRDPLTLTLEQRRELVAALRAERAQFQAKDANKGKKEQEDDETTESD